MGNWASWDSLSGEHFSIKCQNLYRLSYQVYYVWLNKTIDLKKIVFFFLAT